MAKNTTIQVEIPEVYAKRLEQVTGKPLSELASTLLMEYFNDDRRTKIPTKEISVRFPLDWFERMLSVWGEGQIGIKVRALLYPEINLDKARPLTPPPEWKEKTPVHVKRVPNEIGDSKSCIKHVMVPLDWFERLQEMYGDGVSTYIKAVIYKALNEVPSKTKLTIPRRLQSVLDDL